MSRFTAVLWLLSGIVPSTAVSLCAAAEPDPLFPGLPAAGALQALEFEPGGESILRGSNARRQLVVSGVYAGGQRHDLTHESTYSAAPAGLVAIDAEGLVTPLKDGPVTITAAAGGQSAKLQLTVEQCATELPVNFANEIVPLFTKLGCNAGGCHGKSDGQNGFRLSLLGFYPQDDYEYLVYEDRGRRLFPADPEFSLLLLKPSNLLPHGGGQRLTRGSYEWELIRSWIAQGSPEGRPEDPTLTRIEVSPPLREMNRDERQQLRVIAHYSDDSTRDVTRLATFESNDDEMAVANAAGRVTAGRTPGEVAIMVRFQGAVTVFRSVIPLGLPVDPLPPSRTFVDEKVFAKLRQLGIPPSPVCDDATFVRRVTVDLAGRLPTSEEARAFIADANPNKRDAWIDQLLASPGYGDYFANKWSNVLRNKRRDGNDVQYTHRFHAWIRAALQDNMPYDQFARNILAASGDSETHPPVAWHRELDNPEIRMEDTAQLFLGMRLGCAKCHHHPFERWSQDDYYGFEAFFTQAVLKPSKYNISNRNDVVALNGLAPTAFNPRSGVNQKPQGLGGEPLDISPYDDARLYLVDWMTAPENPYFARALVNRYWKHFMGRGIVDPEDDMRVTNPPSNPELLDALATHFIQSRYDLKDLVRTICRSSVYQLSSTPTDQNRRDKQNFSSFQPRRLTAEVLYDSVNAVAGSPTNFGGAPAGTRAVQLPDNGFNDYFLQVFGRPEAESACECERKPEANLAQSLHMLNSNDIQNRVANGGGIAAVLARDEQLDETARITELYYRAYARPPRPQEIAFVLQRTAGIENRQQAYEDLLWAMFNSKEFQFVH